MNTDMPAPTSANMGTIVQTGNGVNSGRVGGPESQRYNGQQFGGSGESTGGSARHF